MASGSLRFGRDKVWVQAVNGHRDNFYWDFVWSSSSSGPGKTKVSWQLVTRGRNWSGNSGYTSVRTKAKFIANYNGSDHIIYQTDTSDSNGETITYTDTTQARGSFEVQHSTNGSGSFTIKSYFDKIYEVISPTNNGCLTPTQSVTLDINYSYSACGAPTSVTVSATNGFVAPEGKFTVNWSGATNGTANAIKNYTIYWYESGEKKGEATHNGSSYSFTVPKEVGRGNVITCQVKANGSVSGYDSTWTSSSNSIKINSLPGAPSISANKTILASSDTAKGAELTIASGQDGDGQATEVYYATSQNGAKQKVTSSSKIVFEGTHYFWTYDGLEYSQSASITIQKNTKPTVGIVTNGVALESKNNKSNYPYVIGLTIAKENINTTLGKNNIYTYYLNYGESADNLEGSITLGTDIVSLSDVRLKLAGNFEEYGLYYKITVIRHDGIENSDPSSGNIYYLPSVPIFKDIEINNQSYTENITFNESNEYFGKKLYFTFPEDSGYTQCKVSISNSISATFNLSTKEEKTRGICEQNFSGGECKLQITLLHSSGYSYTYGDTVDKKRVFSYANGSPILDGPSQIKVYGNSANYEEGFKVTGPGIYSWAECGFNGDTSTVLANVDFSIGYNSIYSSPRKGIVYVHEEGSTSNDLSFKINRKLIYDSLPETFTDKNKNYYGVSIRLIFTDAFGTQYVAETYNTQFIFQEQPTIEHWELYGFDQEKPISTCNYLLKEATQLLVNGTIISFNENPKISLQLQKEGESNWFNYITEFTLTKLQDMTQDYPYIYEFMGFKEIEKITSEYKGQFKLLVTNNANNSLKDEANNGDEVTFKMHKEPEATIISFDFNEKEEDTPANFVYKASVSNNIDISNEALYTEINRIIEYRKTGETTWQELGEYSDTFQELILDFPKDGENNLDTIVVRIKVTTSGYIYGEDLDKTEYSSYSNELTVYNTLPTVSYRKNKLGINTRSIDSANSDTVVYINGYQTKKMLYFVFGDRISTIDLEDGKISGFKVDGGEW